MATCGFGNSSFHPKTMTFRLISIKHTEVFRIQSTRYTVLPDCCCAYTERESIDALFSAELGATNQVSQLNIPWCTNTFLSSLFSSITSVATFCVALYTSHFDLHTFARQLISAHMSVMERLRVILFTYVRVALSMLQRFRCDPTGQFKFYQTCTFPKLCCDLSAVCIYRWNEPCDPASNVARIFPLWCLQGTPSLDIARLLVWQVVAMCEGGRKLSCKSVMNSRAYQTARVSCSDAQSWPV